MRTLLKRPRRLRQFAPRISYEQAASRLPSIEQASHWGQIVLLSDAILALHRDGTASRLFHLIAFLHGDEDLAEWDEVTRDYDRRHSLETIKRALVHLPDGSIKHAQQTDTQLDPYARAIHLTFFPLRPGVVLEFEMQFDRFVPFEIAPGIWSQMFLQGSAPRQHVRFTVAVAEPFRPQFKLHHCDWQPTQTEAHGYQVYQWELHDVPGIEMDPWTPPARDFLPWVDVTTLGSWNPIARHFVRELEPPRETPAPVKKLLHELTNGMETNRQKALAVYRYATRDVRYGRHPRETELEAPRDPGRMLEDLRGDCKDKSVLMVSMFRELGMPANIALVQTRTNGVTPSLPAPWFDHALVRTEVDGEELWLDAAGGPCTFGELPYNDQGIKALILNSDGLKTLDVPAATTSQHSLSRECRGTLDEEGTLRYKAHVIAGGEVAVGLRLQCLDRSDEHRQRFLAREVAADLTGATVTGVRFLQIDDLTEPVCYEYTLTLTGWGRPISEILLFRIPWAEPALTTGPVSADSRPQPMAAPNVFGLTERHEILLPVGFGGYGLPFEAVEECRWGAYSCSIVEQQQRLVCLRRVDYYGGVVAGEVFADFKRFWEACARADAADVVLMKSAP